MAEWPASCVAAQPASAAATASARKEGVRKDLGKDFMDRSPVYVTKGLGTWHRENASCILAGLQPPGPGETGKIPLRLPVRTAPDPAGSPTSCCPGLMPGRWNQYWIRATLSLLPRAASRAFLIVTYTSPVFGFSVRLLGWRCRSTDLSSWPVRASMIETLPESRLDT